MSSPRMMNGIGAVAQAARLSGVAIQGPKSGYG
jgi:hypothetical protein